jgi:hypothetical protein
LATLASRQDLLGETLLPHKDTGETDEEKETTPVEFTIFTKTNITGNSLSGVNVPTIEQPNTA